MINIVTKKVKTPYKDVMREITESLYREGFSIITYMDAKDLFKERLGIEFRNYKILGVCYPQSAYAIISYESHNGVVLPCNILIQEHENGEVELTAENPMEGMRTTLIPLVNELITDTNERLRRAVNEVI